MGARFGAFRPLVSRTPAPEQVSGLPDREWPRIFDFRSVSTAAGFSGTGIGGTDDRRGISLAEMAEQLPFFTSRGRNYPAHNYTNSPRHRQLWSARYGIRPTRRSSQR